MSDEEVTRLLDMVVEEVSLVDRAANKHRFLIVKRDTPMAKPRGKTKAPKDDEELGSEERDDEESLPPTKKPKRPFPPKAKAAPKKPKAGDDEEDPEADTADDEEETDAPPARFRRRRDAKKEAPDPMSALGLALSTLDKLATAVEELEGEDAGDADYADLATELREAGDAIGKAAGVAVEEPEEDETSEEEEDETPGRSADAGTVLTAVREMLTRLEGALGTPAAAPSGTPAAGGAPPAAAPTTEVGKQLRAIASSVKAIDVSVKAQAARLAGLEKRTGLPNSQPPEHTPRRAKDVSWPLDINRPMDRDHVKKELSFHDD